MRYHIDTIPVHDAFEKGGECPLCDISLALEQSYLEYFLGGSVMEPAVRVEVNEKGFCGDHLQAMLAMQNRLGLALMMHTHMSQKIDEMDASLPQKRGGLFARGKEAKQGDGGCMLCERIEASMERYLYTVLHLWNTEAEFRKKLEGSKGLCMPHYRRLQGMAAAELPAGKLESFQQMLKALQKENMRRVEGELEWFTLKFDYRNGDKPWGNSKDALERAIVKMRGKRRG